MDAEIPPSSRRVLIADSDLNAAEATALALQGQGYEVVLVASGDEALQRCANGGFGTILTECRAPGFDAGQIIGRLRDDSRGDRPCVLLVGDASDLGTIECGLDAGADDFITRPIDAGVLLARIKLAQRASGAQAEFSRTRSTLLEANGQLERANRGMHSALESAVRVQQALLPSDNLKVPGKRIAWRLRPCEELAGDILNCMRVDEHHLAFYVLDVSGHGVSSALLSVQVSRLMSPLMAESTLLKEPLHAPPWYRVVRPRRVLERLNELFQISGELTHYFTIVYGLVHLDSGIVRLTSAGHPGPVHVPQAGAPVTVACRSHPIGLFENSRYQECELRLKPGDRLWCYSDGVTEAADPLKGEFGLDRLQELIAGLRDRTLPDAVEAVMQNVEQWCGAHEPADDCTLLAIEAVS